MLSELLARLVEAVARISDREPTVVERRVQLLQAILQLTDADVGHWSWGRGHPDHENIAPIAVLETGYGPGEFARLLRDAMTPEAIADFQTPLLRFIRPDGTLSATRRDLVGDADWQTNYFGRALRAIGRDSWSHAVRYSTNDTWSCLFIARKIGEPELGADERDLLDIALCRVPWLQAISDEWLPPSALLNLTARQRTVLTMVLDGDSRKVIAKKLRLSEATVNTHLASLFRHFKVGSAMEIAALFLRSR